MNGNRRQAGVTRDPYMPTSEQKTYALGASGMMSTGEDALFADNDQASGGHMVKCALLAGVVTCRTSAPSVKHMVRPNVPSGDPAVMVLDGSLSAAIAAEHLRKCVFLGSRDSRLTSARLKERLQVHDERDAL